MAGGVGCRPIPRERPSLWLRSTHLECSRHRPTGLFAIYTREQNTLTYEEFERVRPVGLMTVAFQELVEIQSSDSRRHLPFLHPCGNRRHASRGAPLGRRRRTCYHPPAGGVRWCRIALNATRRTSAGHIRETGWSDGEERSPVGAHTGVAPANGTDGSRSASGRKIPGRRRGVGLLLTRPI